MLSKAQIKHITALGGKKYRTEHSQFIVEGKKSILELLDSDFSLEKLYCTEKHLAAFREKNADHIEQINDIELSKISRQKSPEGAVAVVNMPTPIQFTLETKRYIALDQIRDPGNLGTIIRLADWFGIDAIICSPDCVDLYNPKVVQASMGSLFHIAVHELDLPPLLENAEIPCIAATLEGNSVYESKTIKHGILVIGNEANGISEEVLKHCEQAISIPNKGKAESLNAAMACGILCSHLFD